MSAADNTLERIFQAVAGELRRQRAVLNLADQVNGNHGDHMLAIFEVAAQAARVNPQADLAAAMLSASRELSLRTDGSSQVYGRGLAQFARQFEKYGVRLDDLMAYARTLLLEKESKSEGASRANGAPEAESARKSGAVLKALVAGLAGWQRAESGAAEMEDSRLEMGYLFDLGIIYLQAKQRGGSKAQVIAEAAVAASPLAGVPHRAQSGRLAIQALLEALSGEERPAPG